MIVGKFVENKIILPVSFVLAGEMVFSVGFVVDTGFNGYLTLPVGAMNLPLFSTTAAILADGTQSLIWRISCLIESKFLIHMIVPVFATD